MFSYLDRLKTLEKLYKLESLGVEYVSKGLLNEDIYPKDTSLESKSLKQTSFAKALLEKKQALSTTLSLEEKILNCKLCDRSNSAKPSLTLNQKASFAFIAPVLDVEESGLLSDTKVNEILKNIAINVYKLSLQDACFLSLVKCGTSLPLQTHIKTCKPYLEEELVDKKYAVFFGESLAKALFDMDLKDAMGKILEFKGVKCIVTFSLLDMLKNPSLKKDALSHLNLLKAVIN
ncbi:hypothetical protein BKH43_05740 [Helicobacter sp. 13S00401-1]|uniref:uracil-DNA glycosylase family protein n=1 Tax=Helicobacter sp. 13S00401-1 TaxID=1905758 RepID=UPI000BA70CEE|nr:uracil-DNA glycosylase family protein [Helicobacter sp. 13S00401-1]PAF50112.1 hypothetical protein BKH43_05740 [Helicobacter sp. 13S00401-1]